VVGDEPRGLHEALAQTLQGGVPVFCFGGIGATPDDNTRQVAADVFGRKLEVDAAALGLIEAEFGDAAYPNRVRMACLPEGCVLIPNPCNRVPGFTLQEHHFLPGFPQMAWPMLEWVLVRYYPVLEELCVERSVRVLDVRESDLLELMEWLSRHHAEADLFSLPRLDEKTSVEIGFRGRQAAVNAAFEDLLFALRKRSLVFEAVPA
jgi:molybdopterin-biosynthesis enzyme MoeA-like protein